MTAVEFIKQNYTLTNGGEDYICNHSMQLVGAEDIAEEYHKYKLKELYSSSESICQHFDFEWKSDSNGGNLKYCNDCKCFI